MSVDRILRRPRPEPAADPAVGPLIATAIVNSAAFRKGRGVACVETRIALERSGDGSMTYLFLHELSRRLSATTKTKKPMIAATTSEGVEDKLH
jgi:hypothetical protein